MAYDTNNLFLVDQGGGGEAQSWVLNTQDSLATALTANYISNALQRKMRPGDRIEVRQHSALPTSDSTTLIDRVVGFVGSVSSSGAVLGGDDIPVAVVPTADGLTTGIVPSWARLITAASNGGSANNWITLPAPRIGKRITLLQAAGFEIRSSDPATIGISGGTGAGAESAIAATDLRVEFVCVSLTNWQANEYVAASTEAATEAAA